MLIVYTDSEKNDIGVLKDFYLDQEDSADHDRNTFQLVVKKGAYKGLAVGSYIYSEETELGGRIDTIKSRSDKQTITLEGPTWRGMLAQHIVEPPAGADYYTVSSTASGTVANIVDKIGLSDIYAKGDVNSTAITAQVDRYADALSAINKIMAAYGLKLELKYSGNQKSIIYNEVEIPTRDVSSEEYDFEMTYKKGTNHLICLGKGELKNRAVVHLYVDRTGAISSTQAFTGPDEVTAVLDYPNAESEAELRKIGRERLLASASNTASVSARNLEAELGDILVCRTWLPDPTTGEDKEYVVRKAVKSKITQITNGNVRFSYKIGD